MYFVALPLYCPWWNTVQICAQTEGAAVPSNIMNNRHESFEVLGARKQCRPVQQNIRIERRGNNTRMYKPHQALHNLYTLQVNKIRGGGAVG